MSYSLKCYGYLREGLAVVTGISYEYYFYFGWFCMIPWRISYVRDNLLDYLYSGATVDSGNYYNWNQYPFDEELMRSVLVASLNLYLPV